MAPSTDAIDARLPPLPIGRLDAETLRVIGIGRLVHFRTGPWVLLVEDGSRVVRVYDDSQVAHSHDDAQVAHVHDDSEPPLFVEAPQAPALFHRADPGAPDREKRRATPAPSRAVMLATPRRRRSRARRHRQRSRPMSGPA